MELKLVVKNGKPFADSREVAEMTGKRHDHLVRDIDGYITVLGKSPNLGASNFFIESSYKQAGNGKEVRCYLLTKKGCDMVANKMTGEKGVLFTATYIDKFYEMENKLKQLANQPSYMIADDVERAKRWIEEAKERQALMETTERQAQQLDAQKPMVVFTTAVMASDTSILIGELAKILKQNGINTGRGRLFDWLRANKYLIKSGSDRNMPTQRAMDLGLFEIKETARATPYGSKIDKTTKVTGKGQVYFINKFKKLLEQDPAKLEVKISNKAKLLIDPSALADSEKEGA